MLNCKQAAALMSQEMDKELGMLQKMNLRFHLMMCGGCRNFSNQIMFLRKSCEKFSQQGSPIEQLNNECIILESVLTCPYCGFAKRETMPTDACQFYYECTNCKTVLRPKPGDCCVFCSYGSVKCPSIQTQQGCCG